MSYLRLYVDFLREFLDLRRSLKVVFDCSNGSTGIVLKELQNLTKPGFVRFILINDKPDGNFPAHGPNPSESGAMNELSLRVRKEKADLGVIFDADGDRAFFVDEKGNFIDPDCAAYFLMQEFKPPYVVDVRTGWLVRKFEIRRQGRASPKAGNSKSETNSNNKISKRFEFRASNFEFITSRVGHLFIKKAMRKNKASFGAEYSGHYYFKDFFYADSGILAAIYMMNIVSRGQSISQIINKLPKYYRLPETNFRYRGYRLPANSNRLRMIEDLYKSKARKISKLDGLTMEFGENDVGPEMNSGRKPVGFWFNLRESNTENLLRLSMEAKDERVLKREFQKIKDIILRSRAS